MTYICGRGAVLYAGSVAITTVNITAGALKKGMRNHRKTQERHLHSIRALRMIGLFLVPYHFRLEFCVKALTSTGGDKGLRSMERGQW